MARRRSHALDELDYKIVLQLQDDGRESLPRVARRLGVSEGAIRRRVKRLLEDDFIRVIAVPNPSRLGFEAVALIGLQVELGRIDQVAERLAEMRDVQFVAVTTGVYNVFAWVTVPSVEDLCNFIKAQLASVAGVIRSESFINLEIKKDPFGQVGQAQPLAPGETRVRTTGKRLHPCPAPGKAEARRRLAT